MIILQCFKILNELLIINIIKNKLLQINDKYIQKLFKFRSKRFLFNY